MKLKLLYLVFSIFFSNVALSDTLHLNTLDEIKNNYCHETIDTSQVYLSVLPLSLFMIYHTLPHSSMIFHYLGKRTNSKVHLATFLMIGSEIAIIISNYPSITFDFLASFFAPILTFGTILNLNKIMNRPISQNFAVKTGRILSGTGSFVLAPAYWVYHYIGCSSESEIPEDELIEDNHGI